MKQNNLTEEQLKKLLEKIREDLIKQLSPNYFYSKRTVKIINHIIDWYIYDKRAIKMFKEDLIK